MEVNDVPGVCSLMGEAVSLRIAGALGGGIYPARLSPALRKINSQRTQKQADNHLEMSGQANDYFIYYDSQNCQS